MNTRRSEPVSYGYVKISRSKVKMLIGAWLLESLPKSQWEIVAPIMKKKEVPDVAKPVIKTIRNLGIGRAKLLDVGCSSGYYYDFFRWSKLRLDYCGCDVSPYFISLAKEKYPKIDFKVAPMSNLPYRNDSFCIVLASGVLHCDPDYERAIAELVRVSNRYILLHRLPIFPANSRSKISYYKKIGYGVEMMEVIFDFKTLNKIFKKLKIRTKHFETAGKMDIPDEAYWSTILLEKKLS